jgi:predicted permease
MNKVAQDFRYTLRQLRLNPVFTIVSVVTLAVGIGGTVAIFALVNALLLRPLPVEAPGELVVIDEEREGLTYVINSMTAFSYPRYEALREATGEIFSGLGGSLMGQVSVLAGDEAEVLEAVITSGNYFQVLGLRPALGRFFTDAEVHEPVAVISHALWSERFDGDPGAVGQPLHLNGHVYSVIGIAPEGFGGTALGLQASLWVPAPAYMAGAAVGAGGERPVLWLNVFGRLAPGVSRAEAQAALATIAPNVPFEREGVSVRSVRLEPMGVIPAQERGLVIGFLGMLMATALLVLAVASANVGGMLLARATTRQREMAIRGALGAGRGRLVRHLLTENVTLFAIGGAAGLVVGGWVAALLGRIRLPPPEDAVALDLSIDWRVAAFAFLVALGAGLIVGILPALQGARGDLTRKLKEGASPGVRRARLRSAFVAAQIAVSLLLLVTAGLFVRTLQTALATDTGYAMERVVVASVNLQPHGYDVPRVAAFYGDLLERLESHPGIEAATLSVFAPLSGNSSSITLSLPGVGGDAPRELSVRADVVGPGFFETMGLPLIAGRGIEARPGEEARVAVVNETMAAELWPGENPIGRTVPAYGAELEVVGVARDARYETVTEEATPPVLYVPMAVNPSYQMNVIARGRGETGAALAAIRAELRALDPAVAPQNPRPYATVVDGTLFEQRVASTLIGGFGLLGLGLAAIGLFGVMLYQVSQRTREIGVRLALGANARHVVRMVLARSFVLVAIGIALGLAGALGASRLLSGMLYGVSPTDPLTFVAAPLVLVAVALLAAWIPARRAARVDPMIALRAE